MIFNKLFSWHKYRILATMDDLTVFDNCTGDRVAAWYVLINHQARLWTFQMLVNTLEPDNLRNSFEDIRDWWEETVDEQLKKGLPT